jgi:hypothetical protein
VGARRPGARVDGLAVEEALDGPVKSQAASKKVMGSSVEDLRAAGATRIHSCRRTSVGLGEWSI